jgi:N6-L-threonylcarbamoyladenine synthase/protein kinase Bud32
MKIGPVLGIEGTAWNLSAALFDDDLIKLVSHPYKPVQGGIHPREAAQHHASVITSVIEEVLKGNPTPVAVAFSQGPGLGPCLRIVGTAARALALSFDVPLIGVNHCVAHVEIGRFASGFDDPVVLYASGANTQCWDTCRADTGYLEKLLISELGMPLTSLHEVRGFPILADRK